MYIHMFIPILLCYSFVDILNSIIEELERVNKFESRQQSLLLLANRIAVPTYSTDITKNVRIIIIYIKCKTYL